MKGISYRLESSATDVIVLPSVDKKIHFLWINNFVTFVPDFTIIAADTDKHFSLSVVKCHLVYCALQTTLMFLRNFHLNRVINIGKSLQEIYLHPCLLL